MTTIFGSGTDAGQLTVGLLDAGRATAPPGAPGLSNRARQITQQFLSQSAAGANQLFSLGATSAALTPEQMQTQILALRSSLPESQLARDLQSGNADDGSVAASDNGQNVDTVA